MQYRVICSTADRDQTKDFNSWEDAHLYANEWMNGFTHWNHRHFNNKETDCYENLWQTRNGETVKIEKIDCPNYADQASIAAPGEDEKHYREMREFFEEEIERLQFKPQLPFCSACGTDKHVSYVGMIPTENSGILNFSFCVDCRDQLTLKKNATIAVQERIGA